MAGAMIAIHAAAAAKRRTNVLDAFRVHGATAPDRARALQELGISSGEPALAELMTRGVIRAVDGRGRPAVLGDPMSRVEGFYLDEATFVANRDGGTMSRSDVRAIAVILAMVLLFLGVAVFQKLASG